MFLTLLTLYMAISCILSSILLFRWHSRKNSVFVTNDKVQSRVCVIVTHYGWSDTIETNFNIVLREAKAIDAQVIAVTQYIHGVPDKSYAPLKKYEADCAYLKVLISENVCDLKAKRAQKCQNIRLALQQINADCELIIFIDNDASLPAGSLELMSKSLMCSDAVSATGARFYIPKGKSLFALIVSSWINVGHLFQKGKNVELHWGGFFALKNQQEIVNGFFNALENSISDDCSLSIMVKKMNKSSILVDGAVATSVIEHFSWKRLLEFTNRQTILGFRSGALKIVVLGFFMLAMLPLLSLAVLFYAPWVGLLMWIMISVLFGIVSFSFSHSLLIRIKPIDLLWILFLPFSFLLMGYNALYALINSEICWAEIKYKFNKSGSCKSAKRA